MFLQDNDVNRTVQFRRLAGSPRLYMARGFLTESECNIACRLAEGFGYRKTAYGRETSDLEAAMLEQMAAKGHVPEKDLQEGLAFLANLSRWRAALSNAGGGIRCLTPQVREMFPQPQAKKMEEEADQGGPSHVAIPMHLDTLVEDTFMTIIIYLRTVPAEQGGHTLFPLATVDGAAPVPSHKELLDASREMIASGAWGLENGDPCLDAAAERLAEHAASSGRRRAGSLVWGYGGRGLAVSLRRGDALCFYTRRPDGCIDPAAWHAVAALSPAAVQGRCVCQLFHCLPQVDDLEDTVNLEGVQLPPAGVQLPSVGAIGAIGARPNGGLQVKPDLPLVALDERGDFTIQTAEYTKYLLSQQSKTGILTSRIAAALCEVRAQLRPCRAAGVRFEVSGRPEEEPARQARDGAARGHGKA